MQTIREAKIVIHLEQGKVELKAPDLSKTLADQQRQVDLAKQLEEQLKRVEAAQRSAASASSSSGGSSGGGGGGRRLDYEAREHAKILKIMEDEERAIARLRSAMTALSGAAQQAGEGFFRFARAAVLLGAGNESLEKMVKNLAEVQAYWDVFAGTLGIIQAVTNAQKALAAAQAAYVTALAASTLATQVFTVALVEALAALLAFLAPFVIIAAVIGAVIWAGVAAWDALTTSEEEATEAARAYNEETAKQTQDAIDKMNTLLDLERDLEEVRRSQMTLDQQQASLAGSRRTASGVAAGLVDLSTIGNGPDGQKLDLEAARQYAMEAAKIANEEIALAEKRRDAEIEIRQEKIKQIESAEKALATAQRQLQVEEEKLRSFQAQVGALSDFERDQLINIRNRLRNGEQINQFEEEFLAANGGEGGRKAADAIRARRAQAAGIGVDFWDGTEGAGAAKDMAEASDKVAKALEELAKLLGDAGSAAAAKAQYEEQIKAIREASAKEIEELKKAWEENFKLLELITAKLKELEMAVVSG